MRSILLPSFEYRRERWQNNRGWTREILRADGENWAWRCSIAEIDQDGAFSRFPGRQRLMVLLRGEGLTLQPGGGDPIALEPPHGRATYAGDSEVNAQLKDGPCRALNLIWDPLRCEAELLHRPLVGPMVFFAEAQVFWLIHVLSGRAIDRQRHDGRLAEVGDTLLLTADNDHGGRFLLDGGGELLLLRLRALSPDAVPAAPSHPPA